ncbi:sugar-binding transcriptional regulator [Bhargavaea cecembensis]|uniref:sugar-binding transcriptional regulator n=1 Tax=Bhargavaea cecembensis TaxID=394098 RepID=UPI00058D40B0|nr:sugar-binding domain-containing protein [Bhargavaea cecembensis]
MDELTAAQQRLLPEITAMLESRYRVLNSIRREGPVGRRALVGQLGMTEREVRAECDVLRNQGLIRAESSGMLVTKDGEDVLLLLRPMLKEWTGLGDLGIELAEILGIQEVRVVPSGDLTDGSRVKDRMAREAAELLGDRLPADAVVAVTGGSTVAAIADYADLFQGKNTRFIAARGGTGGEARTQANMIAAVLAAGSDGMWTPFHLPESLGEASYRTMLEEPYVRDAIELYDRAGCVIHGIGNALDIAERRGAPEAEIRSLRENGAVAEAFGFYLDAAGREVGSIRTIGIRREQLARVPLPVAVTGGREKASAILAYMKQAPPATVLVTDEEAAKEMLRLRQ